MAWLRRRVGALLNFIPASRANLADTLPDITRSLLFATTNHIERLDPALSRPGRMDVWVNFTHATKWQAEGIFKCFFPSNNSKASSSSSGSSKSSTDEKTDISQKNLPLPKRKAPGLTIPILEEAEIAELAKRFADAIPEGELSVCTLLSLCVRRMWLIPAKGRCVAGIPS